MYVRTYTVLEYSNFDPLEVGLITYNIASYSQKAFVFKYLKIACLFENKFLESAFL